jgi:AcrR family transcriptional regulator
MSKKDAILKTAAALFASQGYEATTTQQIALEAGVTEPLIYYHFKGKDDIFTRILKGCVEDYFERLETLKKSNASRFEVIEKLVVLHYDLVEAMPNEAYLIFSTCPSRLKDPSDYCAATIRKHRKQVLAYLTDCLKEGVKAGVFVKMPIEETAMLILALINGLVRQRALGMEKLETMRRTAIEFCRRSLLAES